MTPNTPPPATPAEPEHNERCCMEGAWPGWGPHPDCPGMINGKFADWPDVVAGRGAPDGPA